MDAPKERASLRKRRAELTGLDQAVALLMGRNELPCDWRLTAMGGLCGRRCVFMQAGSGITSAPSTQPTRSGRGGRTVTTGPSFSDVGGGAGFVFDDDDDEGCVGGGGQQRCPTASVREGSVAGRQRVGR
jgi:hypothetical protein